MLMLTGKTDILTLLEQSDIAVERALLALYARQTEDEQFEGRTKEENGQGFNGVDSPIFTSFAQQILASHAPAGKRLSQKQLAVCRKRSGSLARGSMRIGKYAGQLLEIATTKQRQRAGVAQQ
jgi:hypothetical protein